MPVLAKFSGIVIRLLCVRSLGARLHAFHGNSELVVGLGPVKVIQGDVPDSVRRLVVQWAREHEIEALKRWNVLQASHRAGGTIS